MTDNGHTEDPHEAGRVEGEPELPRVSLPFDDEGNWIGVPGSDDAAADLGAAGDGGPAGDPHGRVLRRRRPRPRPMRLEAFEVSGGAIVAVGFDPDTGLAAARVLATSPEVGAGGFRRAVKSLARSRALRALAGVAMDVVEVTPYGAAAVSALRLARRAVRAAREAVDRDDVDDAAELVDAPSALDDATAREVLREAVRRRVPPEALAHVARELAEVAP